MMWGMFLIGYIEFNNLVDVVWLFKRQEGNVVVLYNVSERK